MPECDVRPAMPTVIGLGGGTRSSSRSAPSNSDGEGRPSRRITAKANKREESVGRLGPSGTMADGYENVPNGSHRSPRTPIM
jgi:hypothetical protein